MTKKHIATYPCYSVTGRRVGTGYLYSWDDIERAAAAHSRSGVPFNYRWRNDECRKQAMAEREAS